MNTKHIIFTIGFFWTTLMFAQETHIYTYDAYNRLITVENDTSTKNYQYDIMGNRISTTTSSATLNIEDNNIIYTLTIHPNPTDSKVYLTNNKNLTIKNISIYSIDGRLIRVIYKNFETIDISNISSGLYLFEIVTDKGNVVERIIKE
ncbi:T9SS type A sorting domain-containing protein [Psychroserpens ponticola]|uniref:T9SS type A sorting domain-containing protein n=1 Tax=Psychroserpens ponticola TaxID=2932268 RepID=A0ABY7RYQ2_9FLAO|nr:T9SS type A sorting domain-containing protein [Psychroserpens ponticola]WCO01862.1 T9SS type A sorting domain-containing protein [Psychroserpens ponticola]